VEAVVIAYKFLAPGAVSPFSRFAWPQPAAGSPGAWVVVGPGGEYPRIHACRAEQLPYWIERELWRVELSEPAREIQYGMQAERGRLLERVGAWDARCAHEFAIECVRHTQRLAAEAIPPERAARLAGYCKDAAFFADAPHPGCVAYIAAIACAELRGDVAGVAEERAAQAAWLRARLPIA
jgi:hypothetical protein